MLIIDTCSCFIVSDLRKRLRVTLINAQGLDEPGIDGGGLFREFLSETIKTGYNPNREYFMSSDEGTLYPNTLSYLFREDYKVHYEFLGSLLGKVRILLGYCWDIIGILLGYYWVLLKYEIL